MASPSILGSATYWNSGAAMPSRARWLRMRSIHARSSSSLRALASESIGWQGRDLVELAERLAAGALGRRVGREQLGVLGLDPAQLVEQRVVLVVADDRVVEDVIAPAVLAQLGPELLGAPDDVRGRAHSTSRAAGARSRARS